MDPSVAFRPGRSARFAFTSINLSGGYSPGWGLPCSLLIHQIPIILAIFLSTLPTPPPPAPPPPPASQLKTRPRIQWMYFPKLPAVVQPPTQTPVKSVVEKPSPPAGRAANGLVYPGPQEVVSDLPRPTNTIQTLLQPALKNAPIVEPPLALPNLVLSADAGLAPPPKFSPPPPQPAVVEQPKPEPPPINISSVVASAPLPMKPAQSPELIVSPPPPQDLARAPEVKEPEPAPPEPVPARESDLDTVVALSPMPAGPEQSFKIPAGEARGHFAISPKPNLAGSETEPLSTAGNPSKATVVGIETAAVPSPSTSAGSAAGEPPASVTVSFGTKPAGRGETASPVKGVGASGPALAPAPAKSAFAGITVTGGVDDSGAANSGAAAQARRPLQTSYGVSVISTESSGGGLPSFGLFANHDIYTVYVDMREVETDSDPSWILEVAMPQEPATAGNGAKVIAVRQGLVLPFPTAKKRPALPQDLVRRYLRKLIIVSGVLSPDGKMEQMSVKETPDAALNEPVLAALSQWAFRPAIHDGIPFAVKVLLGIPLWLHEQTAPPRHVSISIVPPS